MNCFNGELYLKDAVNSVINQTFKNWELIFWNNKSTDKSLEIISKFKDKRIGRNPKTNKPYLISARKSVSFIPSRNLLKKLNNK